MKTVWKYPLALSMVNRIEVPTGAQLLHVGMQVCPQGISGTFAEVPNLWYLVDPTEPKERKTVIIVGTGDQIHAREGSLGHLGTVLTRDGGALVWHVFEKKE